MGYVVWTPEKDDLCIQLWNSGQSMSQVGDALGVSRSAIAGRLRRLRSKGKQVRGGDVGVHNEAQRQAGRQRVTTRPASSVVRSPKAPVVAMPPRLINIFELHDRECHFPVAMEQGVHLFCGNPARLKSDYCDHHHRVVWQPKA